METLISVVSEIAKLWATLDEYEPRDNAIESTLSSPNQFTREAIIYAIDQQMSVITESAMIDWVSGKSPESEHNVGVINAGNIPLVGLQDFLAVILCGHTYIGSLSRKSPYLIPAFFDTLVHHGLEVNASFVDIDELWDQAEVIIASGSDATIGQIRSLANRHAVVSEKCLLRSNRYGIAVLDGQETDDDLSDLAVDIILHEGRGCRNVALIFAPANLEPDRCLHHLAQARGVFPAHPSTSGKIAMQQAYLAATNQPHAYGDGLEFLLSKGTAIPQSPGHVRWVEYQSYKEMKSTINGLINHVQCIVAHTDMSKRLPEEWNVQRLGSTQAPPLNWKPDGIDTIDFLCSL